MDKEFDEALAELSEEVSEMAITETIQTSPKYSIDAELTVTDKVTFSHKSICFVYTEPVHKGRLKNLFKKEKKNFLNSRQSLTSMIFKFILWSDH